MYLACTFLPTLAICSNSRSSTNAWEVLYEFRCYKRTQPDEPRPPEGRRLRRLHPFVSLDLKIWNLEWCHRCASDQLRSWLFFAVFCVRGFISKECGQLLLGHLLIQLSNHKFRLTDSLPASLPSLFQAFQVELQGFEKEWHLEISEKTGFGSNLEFAIASRCKGIYRLLTDADGLAAVEELEVRFFFFRENTGETSMCSQVWNMSFVPFSRKYGVLETIPCDRCWPHIIWWPWQSQIVLCFCHCSILQLLRTFKLP